MFSIFSSGGHFDQQNYSGNFVTCRLPFEKQLCEIILSLGQQFRMLFKRLFYSGSHFIRQSKTVCAILIEGIMRNICVKLF